jgi:hypothetical protein
MSKEQFGFLDDRQITDAIGVAQEALHNIKTKKSKALVLKLDMMKAYDRVDWSFLRLVLLQIGLGLEATDWIMGCVRSTNFFVLVNGNPSGFFKGSRGLRQGCPLSPLLFLLIVEGLVESLRDWLMMVDLKDILVANGFRITHLLFVDDVILFGKGYLQEWQVFKDALDLFCNASGMVFSNQKSQFLEVGWSVEGIVQLKQIFPFDVKSIEEGFKYLGFFLKPNCYSFNDWIWLLQKVEKRISNWCHRWLTLGGRFILVKSVLENIHVFWLSLAKIPKAILEKIHRRMFSFLWTGNKDKEGIHLD